ncbi:MAG: hypothetical protein ACYCXT_03970 [Acidiferrobacteraceae bacterium]
MAARSTLSLDRDRAPETVSTPFTFYGDLLGMSGFYKNSPSIAYDKLNEFYNTTFYSLEAWQEANNDVKIWMFSDSILMTGDNAEGALSQLLILYAELLHKGLLLRGAIVNGAFRTESRLTRENFKKDLPTGDALARAVGLEKTQKGSRLLIENALAARLLVQQKAWLTLDGYVGVVRGEPAVPCESIVRRICPTPDGNTYELLYFWVPHTPMGHEVADYRLKRAELNEVRIMVASAIGKHYRETIGLLRRCEHRQLFTEKHLNPVF